MPVKKEKYRKVKFVAISQNGAECHFTALILQNCVIQLAGIHESPIYKEVVCK